MSELLTPNQVAGKLRVTTARVYQLMNGQATKSTPLPFVYIAGRKMVTRAALTRWLALTGRMPLQ